MVGFGPFQFGMSRIVLQTVILVETKLNHFWGWGLPYWLFKLCLPTKDKDFLAVSQIEVI
jgi:hypothetical protein